VASDDGLVIQDGGYLVVSDGNATVTWGNDVPMAVGCYDKDRTNVTAEMVGQFNAGDVCQTGGAIEVENSPVDLPSSFEIPYKIKLRAQRKTLNVKENAVVTVKDRGTLEVDDGTLNVVASGTLNVKDSGTLKVSGRNGTINVNGSINVENSGTIKVLYIAGKLNVKDGAEVTVKGSGTLEVSVGTTTVESGGTITVRDDGTLLVNGGTINVEGTITLGSTAKIIWEDPWGNSYNPGNPATIVIKDDGEIIADPTDPGWTSNFYDSSGEQEPPTAGKTYKWTEDLNGDSTTGDSGWKATT
jgi:hypothetical protein